MAKANMDFKNGTNIVKIVLKQCIQVGSSICNTKEILVKNVPLFLRIEFSLTLYIKMVTRETKRKIIY